MKLVSNDGNNRNNKIKPCKIFCIKHCLFFQNKDAGDSDSEAEQEKLSELEQILRDFDPKFEK